MMLTTAHCQNIPGWVPSWLNEVGADWVKTVNAPAGWIPPGGQKHLCRIWTDDVDAQYISRGRVGGRDFVRMMYPRWQQIPATCYSLWNEPVCNGNENLALLREATLGAIEEAVHLDIQVGVMDVAEGNPHNDDTGNEAATAWKWQQLRPAIKAAADLGWPLLRHCYFRPLVEGPMGRWHALGRLAWDLEQLNIPNLRTLVTEWGIDGGIAGHTGKQGWQKLDTGAVSQEQYITWLVEGERYARTLPGVEALMLFGVGAINEWLAGGFDVPEGLARALAAPLRGLGLITGGDLPTPHPGTAKLIMPMDTSKAWYTADSLFGPYDDHPNRARDWNLESGGNSDLGQPWRFPCDGSVVYAGNAGRGHGNVVSFVTVLDGELWNLHWKHMQRLDVKQWQQVKQGQLVGTVGNADGYYAGSHVHEEAIKGAIAGPTQDWRDVAFEYVDPVMFYLEHGVDRALVERMYRRDGK